MAVAIWRELILAHLPSIYFVNLATLLRRSPRTSSRALSMLFCAVASQLQHQHQSSLLPDPPIPLALRIPLARNRVLFAHYYYAALPNNCQMSWLLSVHYSNPSSGSLLIPMITMFFFAVKLTLLCPVSNRPDQAFCPHSFATALRRRLYRPVLSDLGGCSDCGSCSAFSSVFGSVFGAVFRLTVGAGFGDASSSDPLLSASESAPWLPPLPVDLRATCSVLGFLPGAREAFLPPHRSAPVSPQWNGSWCDKRVANWDMGWDDRDMCRWPKPGRSSSSWYSFRGVSPRQLPGGEDALLPN